MPPCDHPSRARRTAPPSVALLALVLALLPWPAASGQAQSPVPPVPSAAPAVSSPPGPAASASPSPGPAASPSPSPTRRARPHETLPPIDPLLPLPADAPRPHLAREVVAYLPYWMVDGSFAAQAPVYQPRSDPYLQGGLLTDIVLFSVGVRRDGSLRLDAANARFVLGETATRIIEAAHARGIRVLVSFVSGGYENNDVLFGDPVATERFVGEAAALVRLRGLDGADLDVELIKRPRFRAWAQTAAELRERMRLSDPDARMTVATNGGVSGANMAARALAAGVDRAFLMGYAYRGPTSSPVGSISPLDHPTDLDLRESLALYRSRGVPMDRVLLGLPAYGLTWPTLGPQPHAERAPSGRYGHGRVTTFYRAATRMPPSGSVSDVVLDDPSARTTWRDDEAGVWFQSYYDTPATLRPKLLTAYTAGLAGVGMWVLGYDGGLPGYPAMIDEVFGRPVVASGRADPDVTRGLDILVSATFIGGFAPIDAFQLSNDGVTWSGWLAPSRAHARPWRLEPGPDGLRQVLVRARDTTGASSSPFIIPVRLDRSGPTIEGPSLVRMPGAWRVSFAAHDAAGIDRTRVRWQVGDGPWGEWHAIRSLSDALVVTAPGAPVRVEVEAVDGVGNVSVASGGHRPGR